MNPKISTVRYQFHQLMLLSDGCKREDSPIAKRIIYKLKKDFIKYLRNRSLIDKNIVVFPVAIQTQHINNSSGVYDKDLVMLSIEITDEHGDNESWLVHQTLERAGTTCYINKWEKEHGPLLRMEYTPLEREVAPITQLQFRQLLRDIECNSWYIYNGVGAIDWRDAMNYWYAGCWKFTKAKGTGNWMSNPFINITNLKTGEKVLRQIRVNQLRNGFNGVMVDLFTRAWSPYREKTRGVIWRLTD